MGDQASVSDLLLELRSMPPDQVAAHIEGLSLTPDARRKIELELARQSNGSLAAGCIVSPTTGDKLIREVLTAPITAQQKLDVISELPIDPARKDAVSAELKAEATSEWVVDR